MHKFKLRWFVAHARCWSQIVSLTLIVTANSGISAQDAPRKEQPLWRPGALATPISRDPIFVYNNWSAYDELSDNIPLTEELAMRELDQMIRWRHLGVRFDYYTIDAFWFDPDG